MKYHRPLINVEKERIRFKVGKSFDLNILYIKLQTYPQPLNAIYIFVL